MAATVTTTTTTTTTTKPKLPQLKTPVSSTFPSELSALSAKTPLSAFPDYIKTEDGIKTPITPPTAYTDFLKLASPITADRIPTPTSAPSEASSDSSSCSCSCENHKSPTSAMLPSPYAYPLSAPATARSGPGRLRIPPSPAQSASNSPLSATSASVRSPFSATARSPFDWDLAAKGRYFDIKSPRTGRSGIRHVREVVTRTITYTPRMSPAPKGKRRKIE